MLASSRGYPLFFLKRVMRSLTSTWMNAEKTDLIFMPKGSTSKSTLPAHAVLLLIVVPDPHLWTLSCQEKTFLFFSEHVQSVCFFSNYSFGCSLSYMALWIFISFALGWGCEGFVGFFFFPFGCCHIVERIRIEMYSWADRSKCVSFFWRPYNSYSQLHA